MKNTLDQIHYLSIFNQVSSLGEKVNGRFVYQGLEAWHDFDGYTCYLAFNQVTMTLMFHGKYSLEYPDRQAFKTFTDKVEQLYLNQQQGRRQ